MVQPARVAIIGAGMVGLCTAWFLQERGIEVTVLDREGVAAGASWGNAGWLAPALTLPLNEPAVLRSGIRSVLSPSSPVYIPVTAEPRLLRFLLGFARHSLPAAWRRNMAAFARMNAVGLDSFDRLAEGGAGGHGVAEPTQLAEPFLAGFASERDRRGLVSEFSAINALGTEVDFAEISGDELRAIEPALSEVVRYGIRIESQRFIDPPAYLAALAESVRARGGIIVARAEATGIDDQGSAGVEVRLRLGEAIRADVVVIATGASLGALARPFGVRRLVQAGRGYSFSVVPEVMPRHPIYFPAQRVACTPLGDRLRVGGMMEFRRSDAPLDPRRIRTIVEAATPLFRGVDWAARREEWVGARPCTADGLPLVGATRSPRVFVAGGHGMWGITLGPLSGRLLADSITGGGGDAILALWSPLR